MKELRKLRGRVAILERETRLLMLRLDQFIGPYEELPEETGRPDIPSPRSYLYAKDDPFERPPPTPEPPNQHLTLVVSKDDNDDGTDSKSD